MTLAADCWVKIASRLSSDIGGGLSSVAALVDASNELMLFMQIRDPPPPHESILSAVVEIDSLCSNRGESN